MRPYVSEILSALRKDNCDEFVRLVKYEQSVGSLRKAGYVIAPSLMLSWAIYRRALRCAESILSGAAGQLIDINVAASDLEIPPIHMAVECFLPDFVDLLLKYGARLDVPCKNYHTRYYFMQPLDAGLEALRTRIKIRWTPDQSVYGLIFALPGSLELEQALCTLSRIMRALPIEETRKAIYYRAAEGEIVELTILLYVDAISELGILKRLSKDEYLTLCHSIATYFLSHSPEEIQTRAAGDSDNVSMDKKQVLGSMMLLFEIFNKTKFSMLGFGVVPQILEKRINDAGFHLTDQRNVGDVHGVSPEERFQNSAFEKYKKFADAGSAKDPLFVDNISGHGTAFQPEDGASKASSSSEIQVGHELKPMADLPPHVFGVAPRFPLTFERFVPRWAMARTCLGRKWPVLASAIRRIIRV